VIVELKKFYTKNKRNHLPWRRTNDPYKILVSEMMLQQTQVDRVLPKYRAFLRAFPTLRVLALAPFSRVLFHWSGLGYNRRAKYLHETAKIIFEKYVGKFPTDVSEIEKLPGIGPYTARAVATFAFNQPHVFIETNIRTVFIHSNVLQNVAVKKKEKISDAQILPLVTQALKDSKMQPREFYSALMDYGSYLKKSGVRLNSKSKHYTKQSKFEGSNRQLRGAILRELLKSSSSAVGLKKNIKRTLPEISRELERLQKEGLVVRRGSQFRIP
jgi:A/G-specific adenine glycosylase